MATITISQPTSGGVLYAHDQAGHVSITTKGTAVADKDVNKPTSSVEHTIDNVRVPFNGVAYNASLTQTRTSDSSHNYAWSLWVHGLRLKQCKGWQRWITRAPRLMGSNNAVPSVVADQRMDS
jgi:hypothetical protein